MKEQTHKIPAHIRLILDVAEIQDNNVRLRGTLSRADYMATNKVLELAGGKWNKKAQAHVFPSDPRDILQLAASEGKIVDGKKTYQFFPTPDELVDRMIEAAWMDESKDNQHFQTVLEPSAGDGAIIRGLRRHFHRCEVTAVEINKEMAVLLQRNHVTGRGFIADFLDLEPNVTGTFDRVLMNPPFTGGQDIAHILHAVNFLKKGGRLVAICANSTKQIDTLKPLTASWEPLESGTFKDTGVSTVLLTINAEAL